MKRFAILTLALLMGSFAFAQAPTKMGPISTPSVQTPSGGTSSNCFKTDGSTGACQLSGPLYLELGQLLLKDTNVEWPFTLPENEVGVVRFNVTANHTLILPGAPFENGPFFLQNSNTSTGTITLQNNGNVLGDIPATLAPGQGVALTAFEDEGSTLAYWSASGSYGYGGGTVTSVSVATANGVSGSVANPTTTPAITLTLGAITPASVAVNGGTAVMVRCSGGTSDGAYVAASSTQATACTGGGGTLIPTGIKTP